MFSGRSSLISAEELSNPKHDIQTRTAFNLDKLQRELIATVSGEVRFDPGSKSMYAVDASNYRQVPVGVVVPKSKEDVVNTIAACRELGVPVLSRGGGTSLAGQCCNFAMVVDWSKYMHAVLEISEPQRWARVLPGTICDELRDAVMQSTGKRLTWGPDPATHDHCCFGGMIGNNSCGAHAQMSGKTDNNIEELEVLLYDGTIMTLGWTTDAEMQQTIDRGGRQGEIFQKLRSLRGRYADLIRQKYPNIPRRVSGYNLDQLIPGRDGRFNIARSVVGSEGTLVTVLEAKCKLIDAKSERVILMLGYPDVYEAADHVVDIDPFNPTALEGIDYRLRENIEKKGGRDRNYLGMLPDGKGWLMAEFGADNQKEAEELAREVMQKLGSHSGAPSMRLFTDKGDMQRLWGIRESGLGATAFVPGEPDTWPGWEDSAVAPQKLGGYLRELRALFSRYEYNPALYGHFGQGCVHCRVDFDLTSQQGIRKWRSFMEEATDLCVKYDGSLSGEHGDGQARAEFLDKMFGSELIEAFREFKSIWDPDWKMNPGKVVDPYRMDENLRLGSRYSPWNPQTHFQFPDDNGSFAHAALRCVGIGKCRRKNGKNADDDTMCPSFMVTHEERHTTRGRAHHLWEMLNGEVIQDGWRDDNVKEALDLCLACKGCKGECPVNVDMATYKAEFLSHYWEGRVRPRHAYAFGLIDQWARPASLWPGMVNLFTQTPGLAQVAKFAAGVSQHRRIPEFAPYTFQNWFRKRPAPANGENDVLLWPDTFNNYFFPETAQAATEILEAAGFRVSVPTRHVCCGRPLYDFGMLDLAKSYLRRVMATLRPQIEAGTPIVVLEPSCASVFRDELHNLFPNDHLANRLREQVMLLSEFLEQKAKSHQLPKLDEKAIVQGHCHHKSVLNFDDEKSVLDRLGLNAEFLNSGCCGMAGSFGFEADKFEISESIGERVLLPRVRSASASTLVIADGFSCREQIAQHSQRNALHLAEVVQLGMHGELDEWEHIAKRRKRIRAVARWRAAGTLAAIGIAVVATIKWSKK